MDWGPSSPLGWRGLRHQPTVCALELGGPTLWDVVLPAGSHCRKADEVSCLSPRRASSSWGGDLGADAESSHSILSTNCLNLSEEGEGLLLPLGLRENAVRCRSSPHSCEGLRERPGWGPSPGRVGRWESGYQGTCPLHKLPGSEMSLTCKTTRKMNRKHNLA